MSINITVFTPTNNPAWLPDVWRSLVAQELPEGIKLNWLLGANFRTDTAPPIDLDNYRDKRVALRTCNPCELEGIGAIKRFMCDAAMNISDNRSDRDIIIELDHDDMLAPNAIRRIVETFEKNSNVGFVYSDFVEFIDNGPDAPWEPHVYRSDCGWEQYDVSVQGPKGEQTLQAMRAFEPSARSVCDILFAPNHVRAWTRSAYEKAGGHDPKMSIGDDHDLVIRTYLTTEMACIHEPLYLYRRRQDGGNSFLARVHEIERISEDLRNRYLHKLIERECKLKGHAMLDFGGAIACPEGWTSVDLADADIVWDVQDGFPKLEQPVGAVRAHDFLEHLPQLVARLFMLNCWQHLVPGGWLLSSTPHSEGIGADCDPSHVSRWNEASFLYHTHAQKRQYLKRQMPWLVDRWQAVRLLKTHIDLSVPGFALDPAPYVVADLCSLKGQRQPGPCFI